MTEKEILDKARKENETIDKIMALLESLPKSNIMDFKTYSDAVLAMLKRKNRNDFNIKELS